LTPSHGAREDMLGNNSQNFRYVILCSGEWTAPKRPLSQLMNISLRCLVRHRSPVFRVLRSYVPRDDLLCDDSPRDAPPCDVPLRDVPPCDVPLCDVPPCDVPLCDVPPCDVPPCDVPPRDVTPGRAFKALYRSGQSVPSALSHPPSGDRIFSKLYIERRNLMVPSRVLTSNMSRAI